MERPVAINEPNEQFMPWAVYDSRGRLRVGFFDRSHDPANHKYGYTPATFIAALWTDLRETGCVNGRCGARQDAYLARHKQRAPRGGGRRWVLRTDRGG